MKKLTCHCGKIEAEVNVPETGFEKIMRCNCSICKRKGYIIGVIGPDDFKLVKGEEYLKLVKGVNLSEYFITSKANAKPIINDDKLFKLDEVDNIKVLVTKAKGKKCSRCWKILENVCQRNNCGLKN